MLHQFSNDKVTIGWDDQVCIHAGECVKNLPGVFDINKDPWINPDGADVDAIEATIAKCPSGALVSKRA